MGGRLDFTVLKVVWKDHAANITVCLRGDALPCTMFLVVTVLMWGSMDYVSSYFVL